MALGIVPGSEVHSPAAGVAIDGEPQRQAALSQGRVASAIGEGVGNLAYDVGMKFQENRNARTVFDADLKMRTAADDFRLNLAKNPDESTWLPAWKEQVQSIRSSVLDGPNVGPDVKRVLTAKLDSWGQATTAEIATAAQLKFIDGTRKLAIADSTKAYSQGDMEGGDNILHAAVANHAMDPDDAKLMMGRGMEIAAKATTGDIIANDPIHAPEKIQPLQKHIGSFQWKSILRSAYEAQSEAQTRFFNQRAEEIDIAPDHVIDPELLRKDVADGNLKQTHMDRLMLRMKTAQGAEAKEKATERRARDQDERMQLNDAKLEVQDHDWANDQTPQKTMEEMKAKGLAWTNSAFRVQLNSFVDSRYKAMKLEGGKNEQPVQQAIFAKLKEDRERGVALPSYENIERVKFHLFGPNETKTVLTKDGDLSYYKKADPADIEKKYGKGVTPEQVLEREQKQYYGYLQEGMREFFKANPKATYEEAGTHLQQLEKPYVMGAVSAAVKPTVSKFQPGQRVKQNGVTYQYDGTQWQAVK